MNEPHEGVYLGADGRELGFAAYVDGQRGRGAALVYLHGIESHAGWFDSAARLLQQRGYDVLCLDRRGSGINRENRGFDSGHAHSAAQLLGDIDAFLRQISDRYDGVVLVGLSWGGKLAIAYALAHPCSVHGLVLITPGLRTLLDLPLLSKVAILFASVVRPRARFATPIEPAMFTTTPRHLQRIIDDPLRLTEATARFFMVSRELDAYIDARISGNRVPIQLHLAGRDRIIDNEGVVDLLQRGAQRLDVVHYPTQTHSIQFDAPDELTARMAGWLETIPACGRLSAR